LTGNAGASSDICYAGMGNDCPGVLPSTSTSAAASKAAINPSTIYNNSCHSTQYGFLVKPNATTCISVTSFYAYNVYAGVVSYFASTDIIASHLIISDSNKGVSLNTGVDSYNIKTTNVSKSLFIGQGKTGCPGGCYNTPASCSNLGGI
jgi:hypothetical protein